MDTDTNKQHELELKITEMNNTESELRKLNTELEEKLQSLENQAHEQTSNGSGDAVLEEKVALEKDVRDLKGELDESITKVHDLQEEQDMLMVEMQKKEGQIQEWEHVIQMLQQDKVTNFFNFLTVIQYFTYLPTSSIVLGGNDPQPN